MTLSDLMVRQARAADKTYNLPDTDGLGLVVAPTGGKSWHLRYYWLGKQKRISLGNYPEVSLREARALRDEARALLAKGINPHLDRKQKRHAVKLASDFTFKAVYDAWVEHRSKELKTGRNSTLSQIKRIFGKDVLPTLGKMSIYDIRRPQLLGVLARIEKRKAFTTAEKVRTWLGQLFRYALVVVEGMESNPATDLDVVAEPKPPVTHNPYLRLPELPEFLQRLRLYNPRGWQTQLGIRLLFLTGVRTGELRLATPDQFDLDRGLWIIPPEIVKQLQDEMRKAGKRPQDVPPYIVPLSLQAIEIVRYLLGVMRPAQKYLLSHRSDLKKRISENTLNAALKRMGCEDRLTGHGIRGTISTALNEIGYPKIWVDAQLSHSDPNKVSSAYNHAKYVEPRRRMMQDWADRLDLLEQDQVEAAAVHLTIHIGGVPAMVEAQEAAPSGTSVSVAPVSPVAATPILVTSTSSQIAFQRLSQVPPPPTRAPEPEISAIQREREEMLAMYESPSNLPVPLFGKLAGKSKDQINRELKAGKLLSISLGNRGQRVPDWQLVPLKHKLAQVLMRQHPQADSWELYRMLTRPHPDLGDRAAIDIVTPSNLGMVAQVIAGGQPHANAPEVVPPRPISEEVRQSVRRLMESAVALDGA
ncbi:integrase arm-type DNA-binding domain-containing protein [Pseudomonas aeruginosa]|uniref:tyrosine-type recombinase/integrase n=1 Tax=Pseudomonas aeruginosa TaxID=287 RepID=UPI0019696637|nr:integrase arm-type DNA-binding domain-containing protein [Pseudomonas aeruginosa]MCV3807431.1 integrase arm-type DNA-binding domain-containing protein [Pseudomonas aeruginosa]MCV3879194.1 integrase arm-type DNA-binding domain-containing protein [Pseudomonas aeruginosa]MCV3935425.1 integrase arm-type DNA-binding domain-containing protein [Pseudomonas aeruginosa]MCV3941752.1 integrase arm-type DNA-binding domain-containing protein [Pseudomonas aeruginosa]MCV3960870.1 integrase arm-type DNA-bi